MSPRRALLRGAIVIAALALPRGVSAEEPKARELLRVAYDVPAECPSRTWFEGSVHFRSSRLVPVGPDEDGAYTADVTVTTEPDGFKGTARITPRDGETTTREIAGARCQTVVEALGFAIAVLLDPEGVNTSTLPSDLELTRIAEAARAAEPAPAPTPPPIAPAPARPVERPSPRAPGRYAHVVGELGAGAWTGVDGVGPRGHLVVEVRREGRDPRDRLVLSGRLGGFLQLAGESTAAVGTVSYVPTGGRLDGGALVRVGSNLRLGGGAHATLLVMPVDAPSADERLRSVRLVPSAGLFARATWEPSVVGVAIEASGGGHFARETYRIDTRSSSGITTTGEVFRLPPVYVQATIGVLVRFVDL